MGMTKNVEKFWWKTEDFWNFRLGTFFTFDSATTTINFSELKISKAFRFPPKFFNIFQHTHKNFKNISGKYRKLSDFLFSHANIFLTYFYIYFIEILIFLRRDRGQGWGSFFTLRFAGGSIFGFSPEYGGGGHFSKKVDFLSHNAQNFGLSSYL